MTAVSRIIIGISPTTSNTASAAKANTTGISTRIAMKIVSASFERQPACIKISLQRRASSPVSV